jgi:hypothetical protein
LDQLHLASNVIVSIATGTFDQLTRLVRPFWRLSFPPTSSHHINRKPFIQANKWRKIDSPSISTTRLSLSSLSLRLRFLPFYLQRRLTSFFYENFTGLLISTIHGAIMRCLSLPSYPQWLNLVKEPYTS